MSSEVLLLQQATALRGPSGLGFGVGEIFFLETKRPAEAVRTQRHDMALRSLLGSFDLNRPPLRENQTLVLRKKRI